jgi:hypothetical protein
MGIRAKGKPKIRVEERSPSFPTTSKLKVIAITAVAAATAGAVAALVIRDQITRHKKDLFSASTLERLAALGYLSKSPATPETVTVLRDFIAWEPRRLLRNRARAILRRMEEEAAEREVAALRAR